MPNSCATMGSHSWTSGSRDRARRRWRASRSAISITLMLNRLKHSKALALARADPLSLQKTGLSAHASYLRRLSVGVRIGGVMENVLQDTRVDRAVSNAAQLANDGSRVVTHVASESDIAANSFWRQGDVALSTRAKFEERFKLRHAPQVNAVLHAFWTAAVRGSGGPERLTLTADSPGLLEELISFDGYYELFSRVYATLLDDYDEDDAKETIRSDFNNDSKGDDVLTSSEYGDALFELADMWVPSTAEEDYASFLWALYRGVAEGDPPTWKLAGACRFNTGLGAWRDAKEEEEEEEEEEKEEGGGRTAASAPQSNGGGESRPTHRAPSGRRQKARRARERAVAAERIQASSRAKTGRRRAEARRHAAVTVQAGRRGQVARRQAHTTKGKLRNHSETATLPPAKHATVARGPHLSTPSSGRGAGGGGSAGGIVVSEASNERLAFGSTQSRFAGGRAEVVESGSLGFASWGSAGAGGGGGGWRYWGGDSDRVPASEEEERAAVLIQTFQRHQTRRSGAGNLSPDRTAQGKPSEMKPCTPVSSSNHPITPLRFHASRRYSTDLFPTSLSLPQLPVARPSTQDLTAHGPPVSCYGSEDVTTVQPATMSKEGHASRKLSHTSARGGGRMRGDRPGQFSRPKLSSPLVLLPAQRPSPLIERQRPLLQLSYLTEAYAREPMSQRLDLNPDVRRAERRQQEALRQLCSSREPRLKESDGWRREGLILPRGRAPTRTTSTSPKPYTPRQPAWVFQTGTLSPYGSFGTASSTSIPTAARS